MSLKLQSKRREVIKNSVHDLIKRIEVFMTPDDENSFDNIIPLRGILQEKLDTLKSLDDEVFNMLIKQENVNAGAAATGWPGGPWPPSVFC